MIKSGIYQNYYLTRTTRMFVGGRGVKIAHRTPLGFIYVTSFFSTLYYLTFFNSQCVFHFFGDKLNCRREQSHQIFNKN